MKLSSILPALTVVFLFTLTAKAQDNGAAPNSMRTQTSVRPAEQLTRQRIWRRIDLRERQNRPMFALGTEVSRVILEAARKGELPAYANDSLTTTITPRQLVANMSFVDNVEMLDFDGSYRSRRPLPTNPSETRLRWTTPQQRLQPKLDRKGKPVKDAKGQVVMETVEIQDIWAAPLIEYRYKDLYELELVEDLVLDKRHARTVPDVKAISLHVPASLPWNDAGIERPIATFRYSDVVKVFRSHPETAIWFNTQNPAEHRNLADAFSLRLFSSYISKVSNADDQRLSDLAGSERQGVMAASRQAAELVEREYELWGF